MKWVLIVTSILESAIMLALPYLSPRPIYFGVRTGSAFRDTPFGRRVRMQYTGLVLLFAAIAAVLLMLIRPIEGIVPGATGDGAGFATWRGIRDNAADHSLIRRILARLLPGPPARTRHTRSTRSRTYRR